MKILPLAAAVLLVATPAMAADKSSLWGSVGNQVLARDTVSSMDTSGDGIVSHDEFTAYNDKQFKAMDANGDNQLTADEIGSSKKKSIPSFK